MNTDTEVDEVEAPQGFDDPEPDYETEESEELDEEPEEADEPDEEAEEAEEEGDDYEEDDDSTGSDDADEEGDSESEDSDSEEEESESIQESLTGAWKIAKAAGATALVAAAVAGVHKFGSYLSNKYGMGSENYVKVLESNIKEWKKELADFDEYWAQSKRSLSRDHEDEMHNLMEDYKHERRHYIDFIEDAQKALDDAKAAYEAKKHSRKSESLPKEIAKHATDVAKTVTGGTTAGIIVSKANRQMATEEAEKRRKNESELPPISMIDAYSNSYAEATEQENHDRQAKWGHRSSAVLGGLAGEGLYKRESVLDKVGKALVNHPNTVHAAGGAAVGGAVGHSMGRRKGRKEQGIHDVREVAGAINSGYLQPGPTNPYHGKRVIMIERRKEASDMNRFGVNSMQENEPMRESLASQRANNLPSHLTASNFPTGSFSLYPQAAIPVSDDPMSAMWAQFNQHRAHAARGL